MLLKRKMLASGLCVLCLVSFNLASVSADTLFQSGFTGTQDSPAASLPEWSSIVAHTGVTQTIDNNMAKFYGSNAGTSYLTLRADQSDGVPFVFQPMSATGNRFEHTLINTVSPFTFTFCHRIWLSPVPNTQAYSLRAVSEIAMLDLTWNRNYPNRLTYKLVFINNKTGNQNSGYTAYTGQFDGVDLDGGDYARVALELRDGGGNDVRVAVRKYSASTATWGNWVTSNWYNPTSSTYGSNAFDPDWKYRWNNNTYYYLEMNNYSGRTDTFWIDDAAVTGDPVVAAETPTFSPDNGYLMPGEKVTITCNTPDAQIYYTLNGSVPTSPLNSTLYTEPVTVASGQTLSARAWAPNYGRSAVKSVLYKTYDNPKYIPRMDGSATIDGNLSEWQASEFVPMTYSYSGAPPLESAAYAARWDGSTNQFYVAVKVKDMNPMFHDNYTDWNAQDGIEVYVHTTGGEPYNYELLQSTAQQYVLGLKTSASRTSDPTQNVWATFAGYVDVPREQVGFQAAGVQEKDTLGNPTGWLFYEIKMTAFELLSLTGPIISPLSVGDVVGVDVVACDKYGTTDTDFGMKSENSQRNKYNDWRQIGVHKLALHPADVNTDGQVTATDIDTLQAAVRAGSTDPRYDLNKDSTVNSVDVDYLVNTLFGTVYGDANLDRRCTFEDFARLQNHYGQSGGWSTGDFNGDGTIGFADFGLLQNHYGQTGGSAAAETLDAATSGCGMLGVSLIAGLLLMGLTLTRTKEKV